MKRLTLTLLLLLSVTQLFAQNLLSGPDHASYDAANNRYLISSSDNSAIVAIDSIGIQSYFLTGLGAYIFGNHISGDTLYVGDSYGRVRAFDLNSGSLFWTIDLAGAHYIMGMATDSDGFLYVVDNNGYNSKIFKINPANQAYEIFVGTGLPGFPNDIAYDELNNRLLLASIQANSPILGIDLDDASVTPIVTPPTFERAGIMMDNDRNVYFTSWYEGLVYKYDETFTNPPILVSEGHGSITGIGLGYNHIDNILAVPVFSHNTVDFVSLADSDDDAIIDLIDNCPDISNFDQADADDDGDGDVCDGCPDDYNPGHEDTDEDGMEDACDNCPEHYNPGQQDSDEDGVGDACDYICGDLNNSETVDILDITFLIGFLYKKGPAPDPLEAADVNSSGTVNLLDVTYLINFLYKDGPEPICLGSI